MSTLVRPRPALPRLRLPAGDPRAGWASQLGGGALTALLLLAVAWDWNASRALAGLRAPTSPDRSAAERVIPLAPPLVTVPVPLAPGASSPSAIAPASPAVAPLATPRAVPFGIPGAPARDTMAGRTGRAPGASGVPAPDGALPTTGVYGGPAALPLCLPPCGVLARPGLGQPSPPLTPAQRDSVARAVAIAVARAPQGPRPIGAAPGPSGIGTPPPPAGIGIAIPGGLPGGGPSAAQRARDRALHADVTARLARTRTRAESLAAVRTLDSLRAARAGGAPAPVLAAPVSTTP